MEKFNLRTNINRLQGLYVNPPAFPDDAEKTRIARTLHYVIVMTILLLTLVIPVAVLFSEQKLEATVISVVGVILQSICLYLVHKGHLFSGAAILVSHHLLNAASVVFLAGGAINATVIIFIPGIAMAALFFGVRGSLIASGLTLLYLLVLYLLDASNIDIPVILNLSDASELVTILFGIGFFLFPLHQINREMRSALRQANAALIDYAQAERQARENEERFRLISSVTSDYTFHTRLDADEGLDHVFLTGAFESISGYTPEEFLKIGGWRATLHPDDVEEDERAMSELHRNRIAQSQVRIIRKDGQIRWVYVNAYPVWDEQENRLVGINGGVRDITEQVKAQKALMDLNAELHTQANQMSALNEIARDISKITDLPTTLKAVLRKLQVALPLDVFFVALADSRENTVYFPIMYDEGRFWDQGVGELSASGWVTNVMRTGEAIMLNRTIEEMEANQKTNTRLGNINRVSASILMAPLPIGNANIGVISVQSYTLDAYDEDHKHFLIDAALQIAIAVENARLYDSLQSELSERKRLETELQTYSQNLENLVEERTQSLNRAKEQLELILNTTTNALAFANAKGDIVMTNSAFLEMFEDSARSSIEGILSRLIDERQIQEISDALVRVIYNREKRRLEARILSKETNELYVDLTLIPVTGPDGEARSGILLSGHDITHLKEVERFKARFVADAVHDLATPITGLSTRLYLLKRNPERLQDHVKSLENQVAHLKNLLDDLKTLSRMDRGMIEVNLEPCNINTLVNRVYDTYEPVALDKNQILTLNIDDTMPQIQLDQRQIERVLVNLVSNALNYTPEHKEVVISTSYDAEHVKVQVTDQGMGIESQDIPRIFDRFYRTNEARYLLSSGTGLGLAITKNIVELHNGKISVISEIGQGSTFTVCLPR